jgi:uncharacterized protein
MIFIDITEECNLNCKHCYVKHNKGILSINYLKKFIEYLIHQKLIQKEDEICFIGGEPFLYKSHLKKCIKLISKLLPKTQISVFSNLSFNYEEIKDILNLSKIKIYTSLDGTEFSHNNIRRLKDGNSYELVYQNLKKLSKIKDQIEVVYTFDPNFEKQDFIKFIDEILTINKDPEKWLINLRPAFPNANFNNSNWYLNEIEKLTKYWISNLKKGIIVNISLISGALKILNEENKVQPCGIGDTLFVLKPNGDIWPCNQYYRINQRKIGNISKNSFKEIEKERIKLKLFKNILYEKYPKKKCDCFLFQSCRGIPCPASYEENNFECNEHEKVVAKIIEMITYILQKNFTKEELKKINLKENNFE